MKNKNLGIIDSISSQDARRSITIQANHDLPTELSDYLNSRFQPLDPPPIQPRIIKPLRRDFIPKSQTPAIGSSRRHYTNYQTNEIVQNTQYQGYAPFYLNQSKDTSFSSQFAYMYQDDSLSAMDRKKMQAFMSHQKRLERIQRNLMLKSLIDEENLKIHRMQQALEERRRKQIDIKMNEAAKKIQNAYRRKKDGKSMLTHLKDVMKRLQEAEKAKIRLFDTLENMQEETHRYYHNYLMKNIDKIIFLQSFVRGRIVRREFQELLRRQQLVNRIATRADKLYVDLFKKFGMQMFKDLLFDAKGNKIPAKPKKQAGKDAKPRQSRAK
ncbi:hypothetical protein FGO68_gene4282 [Halteria grandinella]|uniref:Uncharacterized protein n=1 Tax=Halteria grandinella TaxID=5974 RepID=A0A8J8NTS8_HALGN|nr:hypothetical protein FGO68_gene4282 [Halteria grandinella]